MPSKKKTQPKEEEEEEEKKEEPQGPQGQKRPGSPAVTRGSYKGPY